jgi:hypothetical protein
MDAPLLVLERVLPALRGVLVERHVLLL